MPAVHQALLEHGIKKAPGSLQGKACANPRCAKLGVCQSARATWCTIPALLVYTAHVKVSMLLQ